MSTAQRIKLLKQTVDLSESRNRFSEIDEVYQNLQQRKLGYERSGDALLKSASSVHPGTGVHSGTSLRQRSAWIDKACELRRYTLLNKKAVSSQMDALAPEYHTFLNRISVLEDLKAETEMQVKRELLLYSRSIETAELEDLCEVSLIHGNERR